MVVILVPCLATGAMVVDRAVAKLASAREANDLARLVELAVIVGDLLHETQKERGSSSLFITSGGTKFSSELQAQRALTDQRRIKYFQFVRGHDASWPPVVAAALRMTDAHLNEIEARRRQTSDLSVSPLEIISYYNALNQRLLESVASVASNSADSELRAWSTGYFAFLTAKERTGMERANLSNVFGADHFSPGQFFTVASLVAAQRSYLHIFDMAGPPEAVALFKQKAESPPFAEVEAKEKLAFANDGIPGRSGFGVEPASWFRTITRKIDLMKEVENATARAILTRAAALQEGSAAAFRDTLIAGGLIFLVIVLGAWLIAHRLVLPIRRLILVADRVCAGDLEHHIDTSAPAEVGELASSFQRMVSALKLMRAAQRKTVPGRTIGSRAVLP